MARQGELFVSTGSQVVMPPRIRKGRPPKCTPALRAAFLSAVRAGAYPHLAALFVGISIDTYLRWMDPEKSPGEPYASFRLEIGQAEACAAIGALQSILAFQKETWLPGAWLLERRFGYTPSPPAEDTGPRRLIISDSDDTSRDAPALAEATESVLQAISEGPDEGDPVGPADGENVGV